MLKKSFVLTMVVLVGCITRQSALSEKAVTAVFCCAGPGEFIESNQMKELNVAISKVYDEFFSSDELEELCRFYSREEVSNLMQEMKKSVDTESVRKFEGLVRNNLRGTTIDKIKSEAFRDKISDTINNYLANTVYPHDER